MSDEKTTETRRGLLTGAKGKVKEIAGAVSGNESLINEGQLQQPAVEVRTTGPKHGRAEGNVQPGQLSDDPVWVAPDSVPRGSLPSRSA